MSKKVELIGRWLAGPLLVSMTAACAGAPPPVTTPTVLVVGCWPEGSPANPAPGATQAPVVADRKTVEGDGPMFCTLAADKTGWCYLNEQLCQDKRTELGDGAAACVQHVGAACFNATAIIDQYRQQVCAPSVTECEAKRAAVVANADLADVMPSCIVYRQRVRDRDGTER